MLTAPQSFAAALLGCISTIAALPVPSAAFGALPQVRHNRTCFCNQLHASTYTTLTPAVVFELPKPMSDVCAWLAHSLDPAVPRPFRARHRPGKPHPVRQDQHAGDQSRPGPLARGSLHVKPNRPLRDPQGYAPRAAWVLHTYRLQHTCTDRPLRMALVSGPQEMDFLTLSWHLFQYLASCSCGLLMLVSRTLSQGIKQSLGPDTAGRSHTHSLTHITLLSLLQPPGGA